jgi:hypothetical protein
VLQPIVLNETPQCFLKNPTSLLISWMALKTSLRCRGKLFSRCSHIQRAVFENNLSLLSKLLTSQHPSIFYCDRNELDISDNSGLMLAVKLINLDAVKVLTDAHCSAKLASAPHIPSAFELACALKHR